MLFRPVRLRIPSASAPRRVSSESPAPGEGVPPGTRQRGLPARRLTAFALHRPLLAAFCGSSRTVPVEPAPGAPPALGKHVATLCNLV